MDLTGPRRSARLWLIAAALSWLALSLAARVDAVQAFVSSRMLLTSGLVLTYVLFWGWRASANRLPRQTTFRAVMVTITLLVVVAGLEVLAAAGIVHWGAVLRSARNPQDSYMTSFVQSPDGWFQRPAGARWTSRPRSDLEARWGLPASLAEPISFTYDARGFRNVELFERADVVLIGDSYVEGAYVSDHQTAARLLQNSLGRPVVNLGVAGFGPSYELHALTRHAAPLGPQVVIWFFFEGNDLYDPDFVPEDGVVATAASPPSQSTLRRILRHFGDSRQLRQRGFASNFVWALSTYTHPLLPNRIPDYGTLTRPDGAEQRVYFGDYGRVPWTSYEVERWGEVREFLRAGAEFAREERIRLLTVFIPIKFRVYRPFVSGPGGWVVSPLRELFGELCREADLACFDLTEPFQQSVREGGTPYATMDTHWGPEGHEIVAALLATELKRRGWLGPSVRVP